MIPAKEPLTLEERSSIEVALGRMARFEQASAHAKVEILKGAAKASFRLAAEVALLENQLDEASKRNNKDRDQAFAEDSARRAEIVRLSALLEAADRRQFGENVEIENLRKMLDDSMEMLAAANEREQIQLKIAVEAVKQRNAVESLLKDEKLASAAAFHILGELRRRWPLVIAELETPVPMCKPDPLEGIIPPTGPTTCCKGNVDGNGKAIHLGDCALLEGL
jgi:hypothetical protein